MEKPALPNGAPHGQDVPHIGPVFHMSEIKRARDRAVLGINLAGVKQLNSGALRHVGVS